MSNTDTVVELLQALVIETRAANARRDETNVLLRRLLDHPGRPPKALRRTDLVTLEKLLPVLAEQFAGVRFSVWELYDVALHDSGIAGRNLKIGLGTLNAKACGRLLERACGHDINGLRVERDGLDAHGNLWKITGSALP